VHGIDLGFGDRDLDVVVVQRRTDRGVFEHGAE
jgi:hypothetical protein